MYLVLLFYAIYFFITKRAYNRLKEVNFEMWESLSKYMPFYLSLYPRIWLYGKKYINDDLFHFYRISSIVLFVIFLIVGFNAV